MRPGARISLRSWIGPTGKDLVKGGPVNSFSIGEEL